MIYTAHIRDDDKKVQTVSEHIAGVKLLAEKFSVRLMMPSILKLAAVLHDVGKLTVDFDDYINGRNNLERGKIDHSFAGAKFLYEYALKFNDELMIDTAEFIGRIIISHHGLHDWIDNKYQDYYKYRISKTERYEEIYDEIISLLKDEIETLLPLAIKEFDEIRNKIFSISKNRVSFDFYLGMLERLAQSILVDADRTDTSEFMLNLKPREIDVTKLWNEMQAKINNMSENFRKKTDLISQQRMSISDRCAEFAKEKRGICRLIVPTGGGKTISSFRFAVDYCKEFNKDKIIYVAPFMSILEQNADVIKSIVGNDDLFLEHHSNIISEIEKQEELNDYELKCEKWDNPVIATTMVQFLNAVFDGKMSSVRRFHSLSNSVIIIDEIQSIPVKCVNLFNLAMNFLAQICDSTIVICSATQPKFENSSFPLMLDKQSSMTGDFTDDFEKFKRTEIISDVKMPGFSFKEVATYTYNKYKENGNALIILNTKKSALEVFKSIKDLNENSDEKNKAEIIHLSTNMCPAHRKTKLEYIRKLLNENKPIICVTTQLIEAGVDVSFNCVIRSLAGLDSIAQAAGRCNRHGENKICPVYVVAVKGEVLSSLKEIQEGKEISLRIITQTDYDLLSDESMTVYFNMFYKIFEKDLSFPVKDLSVKTNLLDLLSINKNRQSLCKNNLHDKGQAFATAGESFEVIAKNTKSLIVPYNNEAEEIIANLNSDIDIYDKIRFLRKAQKYIVNVYPKAFDDLFEKQQIYELKEDGIFALRKEHFNDDYGIDNENTNIELICY